MATNTKKTFKVPSLADLCLQQAIDNVRHIGNVGGIEDRFLKQILPHCNAEELKHIEDASEGIDLSHLTDYLWENFYKKEFGERIFNKTVEDMKRKNVLFKWKNLYEAKLKDMEAAEQRTIERMRQQYQNLDAQKKSRQVKPCTKVPPSSHKRNCYGGWGPASIVGSSKSNLMKKSRLDFLNSQEVRNLAAMRKNVVQKDDRPSSIRKPGGSSSNGSASIRKPGGSSSNDSASIRKPGGSSSNDSASSSRGIKPFQRR